MIILRSFWNQCGISLGSLWHNFWNVLGSLLGRVGIIMGSFWNNFGIILGSFWDCFGIVLGSFCDHFGIILKSCLGSFCGGAWGAQRVFGILTGSKSNPEPLHSVRTPNAMPVLSFTSLSVHTATRCSTPRAQPGRSSRLILKFEPIKSSSRTYVT